MSASQVFLKLNPRKMQKITPFLWFDKQAEEAVNFYTTVFKKSKINTITRYNKAGAEVSGMAEGMAMTVEFELDGQTFVALNGGPVYKFSPAISFVINCKDQEEIDWYWSKLTGDGGQEVQCGWLTDQFGVSWQVVPTTLPKLLTNKDPEKAGRVMQAMLAMKKIDISALEKAAK